MVAPHGWKPTPSPRRGFTVVEALREQVSSPVVVGVHDSRHAAHLFRAAADEAMSRHGDLVVLDYGATALQDELDDEAGHDLRERSALRTLLANPHVQVLRVGAGGSDLERTVAYCESSNACLLVLGADHIGSQNLDATLSTRIFNGAFDVLVLAEPNHVSPPTPTG